MLAEPTDAILVLIDIVEYTPQARLAGGRKAQEFDQYLASELSTRAERHEFKVIKTTGDGALLWGQKPAGLVGFICDLFMADPIKPHAGFTPAFRILAHKDYFTFSRDDTGRVTEVHGLEGILLFRLEKTAHVNRAVVTTHLFAGLRHLLPYKGITNQLVELPSDLKGMGADSPRQVYVLRPPLADQIRDQELESAYRLARSQLHKQVQYIPVFGQLYPSIPFAQKSLHVVQAAFVISDVSAGRVRAARYSASV